MNPPLLPAALLDLRQKFHQNGFDIKLVGGCVRDWLSGQWSGAGVPHDIDLCTDATPDEQRSLYRTYNVRHIDTGLQHGTWTVVLNGQTYEITSLRTETDCDGRHATVAYTRDWLLDLSRRDLTVNAMLMSFEGEITDPYHGAADLKAGIARFVGVPDERMREDYLRILRWFRFHARISKGRFHPTADVATHDAVVRNMAGLRQISRERVWSEVRRLLADPHGLVEVLQIILSGVAEHIDLPVPLYTDTTVSFERLEIAHRHTKDPVSLLAAYLGSAAHIEKLADDWHFSNAERQQALLIAGFMELPRTVKPSLLTQAKRMVALDQMPQAWLIEALRVIDLRVSADHLAAWTMPVFPVRGSDLIAAGVRPGPEMGRLLARLRTAWADKNYQLNRDDLLALVG
jgi:tRNA nucleotidyltransferase/poly(A) polymerase